MSPPHPDHLDSLLTRIDEALADDDPFGWSDSMVWRAPLATHDAEGRVYLDQAGYMV